jgi:hypothetical protein
MPFYKYKCQLILSKDMVDSNIFIYYLLSNKMIVNFHMLGSGMED